jgi:hypothetical protein
VESKNCKEILLGKGYGPLEDIFPLFCNKATSRLKFKKGANFIIYLKSLQKLKDVALIPTEAGQILEQENALLI